MSDQNNYKFFDIVRFLPQLHLDLSDISKINENNTTSIFLFAECNTNIDADQIHNLNQATKTRIPLFKDCLKKCIVHDDLIFSLYILRKEMTIPLLPLFSYHQNKVLYFSTISLRFSSKQASNYFSEQILKRLANQLSNKTELLTESVTDLETDLVTDLVTDLSTDLSNQLSETSKIEFLFFMTKAVSKYLTSIYPDIDSKNLFYYSDSDATRRIRILDEINLYFSDVFIKKLSQDPQLFLDEKNVTKFCFVTSNKFISDIGICIINQIFEQYIEQKKLSMVMTINTQIFSQKTFIDNSNETDNIII